MNAIKESIHKQIGPEDGDATSSRCVVVRASRVQFTTQWRGLNCNASMLLSLWPAPTYLTSSRVTVFHHRAFVKDKYTSAKLYVRVRAYRREWASTHRAYTSVHEREKNAIRVIRTQPNDSSARSALLSIELICRIAQLFRYARSPARLLTNLSRPANARGIFVYLHWRTLTNASETEARYPHRSGFAYRG